MSMNILNIFYRCEKACSLTDLIDVEEYILTRMNILSCYQQIHMALPHAIMWVKFATN
jgi:hypothetical protein